MTLRQEMENDYSLPCHNCSYYKQSCSPGESFQRIISTAVHRVLNCPSEQASFGTQRCCLGPVYLALGLGRPRPRLESLGRLKGLGGCLPYVNNSSRLAGILAVKQGIIRRLVIQSVFPILSLRFTRTVDLLRIFG